MASGRNFDERPVCASRLRRRSAQHAVGGQFRSAAEICRSCSDRRRPAACADATGRHAWRRATESSSKSLPEAIGMLLPSPPRSRCRHTARRVPRDIAAIHARNRAGVPFRLPPHPRALGRVARWASSGLPTLRGRVGAARPDTLVATHFPRCRDRPDVRLRALVSLRRGDSSGSVRGCVRAGLRPHRPRAGRSRSHRLPTPDAAAPVCVSVQTTGSTARRRSGCGTPRS